MTENIHLESQGPNKYSFGAFGQTQKKPSESYQFLSNPLYNMTPFEKSIKDQYQQPISTIQKVSMIESEQKDPQIINNNSNTIQLQDRIETAQFPPPTIPQSSIKPVSNLKQSQFVNSQSYDLPQPFLENNPQQLQQIQQRQQNISIISEQQPPQTAHFLNTDQKQYKPPLQHQPQPQPQPQLQPQVQPQGLNRTLKSHRNSQPILPILVQDQSPQKLVVDQQQQQIQQNNQVPIAYQQRVIQRPQSADIRPPQGAQTERVYDRVPAGARIIPEHELPDYIQQRRSKELYPQQQLLQQQQNQIPIQQNPQLQQQFMQRQPMGPYFQQQQQQQGIPINTLQQPLQQQQQGIPLQQQHFNSSQQGLQQQLQQGQTQQNLQGLLLQQQQNALHQQRNFDQQGPEYEYQSLEGFLHPNRRVPYDPIVPKKLLRDEKEDPLREIRSNYLYQKDRIYKNDYDNDLERERALLKQQLEEDRQFYLEQQKRQIQQREHPQQYYKPNQYPDFPYNRSTFEPYMNQQFKSQNKQDLPNAPEIQQKIIQNQTQRDQILLQSLSPEQIIQQKLHETRPLILNPNIHKQQYQQIPQNIEQFSSIPGQLVQNDINQFKNQQKQQQQIQKPFYDGDYNASVQVEELEKAKKLDEFYRDNDATLRMYKTIEEQERRQGFIDQLKDRSARKSYYGDVIPRQKYAHRPLHEENQVNNPKHNRFDSYNQGHFTYNSMLQDTLNQPSLYDQFAPKQQYQQQQQQVRPQYM